MHRTGIACVAGIAVACCLAWAGPAAAQSQEDPLLARSELVSPKTAPAGELIPLAMVFRSDSDDPADVSFTAGIGDRILFGGTPDATAVRFDPAERQLTWRGTIPPHGERRVEFSVVAPLWTARTAIDVRTGARRGTELLTITRNAFVEIGESRRRAAATGVRVGPIIVGPYEFVILGALVLGCCIGAFVSRTLRTAGLPRSLGPFAGLVAFLLLTAAGLLAVDGVRMLVTDVRILTAWAPTPCTIVDAAAVYQPPASNTTGRNRPTPKGSDVPLAVVRYQANGAAREFLGFWSDSHILVGRRAARLVAPFKPGTAATCWVDPADEGRFVLLRRPGFGHVFLLAVIAFVVGVVWMGVRFGRSRRSEAVPN
jgi:hypothetical protein